MGTERVTATVIDIFENGDIRTDRDGGAHAQRIHNHQHVAIEL